MTTLRAALLACIVALTLPLGAQEKATLTVADSNADYRVAVLQLTSNDPQTAADEGHIYIRLDGIAPWRTECTYNATTTPTGTFLINALNKANLSTAYAGNATTGSLKQRILHRLVVMNEAAAVCNRALAGTVTGSPE